MKQQQKKNASLFLNTGKNIRHDMPVINGVDLNCHIQNHFIIYALRIAFVDRSGNGNNLINMRKKFNAVKTNNDWLLNCLI